MGLDVSQNGTTLRQHVGYMPEHDCLPPDATATEFVSHMAQISGLPASAARERTAETLRHVGLFEARYRQINGYSTGMKQRVKLAQSLVHDPRLVLLDEPTNGLDPQGREEMLDLIRRIGTEFGVAVILSSHLLAEIEQVCDHLVEIEEGRLRRSAPMSELTATTGSYIVEVEGDSEPLVAFLRGHGASVRMSGRYLVVEGSSDEVLDWVRDGVVEHSLGLIRLEQGRRRLEELFEPQPVGAGQEAPPG
jgi:ABC-2 type transport system ATP-binding protein